jgi:hypothetical protein
LATALLSPLACLVVLVSSADAAGFEVGQPQAVQITKPANAHTEVPPYLLPDRRGLLLSTAWTYRCGLTRLDLVNDCSNSWLHTFGDAHFFPPAEMPNRPWRRNYHGSFSAELLGGALVQFNHGENKNERIDGRAYQNTVQPSVSVDRCWDGSNGEAYQACWPAYSGFITATLGNGSDLGPILWPEQGYLRPNGARASNGVRHPHSILHAGWVYLFYLDTDWSNGARAGIRVARAPASARGRGFRVWRNGSWHRALPPGIGKGSLHRAYARRGPSSTPILGPGRGSASFQVARRVGGTGFLGVEQWFDSNGLAHIGLRRSANLVDWGPRSELDVAPARFESFPLNYPIFLNAAGITHTRVGDFFYLLGTRELQVHRIAVRAR